MESITSKNNEKIKFAVSLREHASVRNGSGLFLAEGARLCADAAVSGVEIPQFFFTQTGAERFATYHAQIAARAETSYLISDEVAAKLSDTRTPQGLFCVCRQPETAADFTFRRGGNYLLLENVQDPANLGAIARTAEALGLDALLVSGGCDLWNPKALRASMGAFFRCSVVPGACGAFLTEAKRAGLTVAASTPDADAQKITSASFPQGVLCIVGNEGSGVTPQTMAAADVRVTIPMRGRAESLNAATAAAILIWEMVRHGN